MATESVGYTFTSNFNPSTLTDDFFKVILKKINSKATLVSWHQVDIDTSDSIMTDMATLADTSESGDCNDRKNDPNEETTKYIGFCRFKLVYTLQTSEELFSKSFVIKSKTSGENIVKVIKGFFSAGGQEYAKLLPPLIDGDMEHREIELYRLHIPEITSILPDIYLTVDDPEKEVYLIAMEDMNCPEFKLSKTIDSVHLWSENDIKTVLKDLAHFHAYFLGREKKIPNHLSKYLSNKLTFENMRKKEQGLRLLLKHNKEKVPEIYDIETCNLVQKAIDNIEIIYEEFCKGPFTLTHSDAQPRNLCLRCDPTNGKRTLFLFDWESCTIDIPHRDIIDFLANVLPPKADPEIWNRYRDAYREYLEKELHSLGNYTKETQKAVSREVFDNVFRLCVVDFMMDRFAFYTYGHRFNPHEFFLRVTDNTKRYMKSFTDLHDIF